MYQTDYKASGWLEVIRYFIKGLLFSIARLSVPFFIYGFHWQFQNQMDYLNGIFENASYGFYGLSMWAKINLSLLTLFAFASASGIVLSFFALGDDVKETYFDKLMVLIYRLVFLASVVMYVYVLFSAFPMLLGYTLLGFFQPYAWIATIWLLFLLAPLIAVVSAPGR